MPSIERVVVAVGGIDYSFEEFSCAANARSPERTFQVKGPKANGLIPFAAPNFKPGTPCSVSSNGSRMVTGFINTTAIKVSPTSHSVTIDGKSQGADCIKGSVDHDKHEWRDKDIVQIANDTGTGVKFKTDEAVKKIPVTRANVGQKAVTYIGKLARKQGLFLCGEPDGSVNITRHGKYRHAGAIIEGFNLIEGEAVFSEEERFAEHKVKGHQPQGSGEKNFRYEEKAKDSGARDGPKRVLTPRTALDRGEARQKAEQSANNSYGSSVQFTAKLQGFRDEAGMLWTPGWLVMVVSPSCDVAMELAIDEVNWSQDATGGSFSNLSLVHPSALGGGGGGKSGSAGGGGGGQFGGAGFGGR
ncbi:hypothetical protein [uncultured Hyphomicrobium sp.]|uniref:phage baseplate assembly protein n=1 Tax=uncultured Hyphomicrobium sp. TaxID=194373 RepID=UPI0025D38F58|nr:hypothetical protein [uncultured Hyphomicrobium sp.]